MLEPGGDVAHLARFLGGVGADIAFHRLNAAVDHPEAFLRAALVAEHGVAIDQLDDHGPVFLMGLVHILEGLRGLDDMRVGVDTTHGPPRHGGVAVSCFCSTRPGAARLLMRRCAPNEWGALAARL